jgi:hypothetical protein
MKKLEQAEMIEKIRKARDRNNLFLESTKGSDHPQVKEMAIQKLGENEAFFAVLGYYAGMPYSLNVMAEGHIAV